MRVVFVNLHKNGFYVWPLSNIIRKVPPINKRRFFLDYLFEKNVEVLNLITPNGCGFPSNIRYHIHNLKLIEIEAEYVYKKSCIEKGKIRNIEDADEIRPDDVVIYYSTFNPEQFENAIDVRGIKIVDHIHFFGDKEKAELLKTCGLQYYVFDVELQKYSKLYQKNYAWSKAEFIMFPFTWQRRFCVKRKFEERKTKAVAMGTLTRASFPEFIETYGTEYYQPHREMLLNEAPKYREEMDSFISEYLEKRPKVVHDNDMKIIKIYKRWYNFFSIGKQKNYFSFNMVDKYNEYKMFICPEDVNGSYGIGTIEGMACGCAMIGLNNGVFEDMGMQAGVHYISYDGTMEDLIDRIRFYKRPENQKELRLIARTGCEFVRKNFSEENVAQKFLQTIKEISENVKK